MKRRGLLLALPLTAAAELDWRRVALPYYTPTQLLESFRRVQQQPAATALATAALRLGRLLEAADLSGARSAWREALQAWLRLSGVSTGPLLERRSAARLDFPLREPLLRRLLSAAPRPLAQQSAAVQGLGALEWLLWTPAALDTAGQAHALACAAALSSEAQTLQAALAVAFAVEDDEAQGQAFAIWFNQLLAGLAQLRQQGIERPLGEARSRGLRAPLLPRALSGTAFDERRIRWQVIESQLRHPVGQAAPQPGAALISIEALLRGRGLNPLADRLLAALRPAALALQRSENNAAARLATAARALATLQRFIELELAEALALRVTFSSADGD
ncbi:MAG: imelysin family protein [Inhella sp.]